MRKKGNFKKIRKKVFWPGVGGQGWSGVGRVIRITGIFFFLALVMSTK